MLDSLVVTTTVVIYVSVIISDIVTICFMNGSVNVLLPVVGALYSKSNRFTITVTGMKM